MTRHRLIVDPIACDGFGYCVELAPELVRADEWGFPIIDGAGVAPELEAVALRAVRACPRRALKLAAETDVASPHRR
jgi:ferredoxin